mgnify:CR=1 FL=1
MALTKKQKKIITERYKKYYRMIEKDLVNEELKDTFKASFYELKNIMEDLDTSIFILYFELNEMINEIAGREVLFTYEYNPKNIYNILENYDYDRRIGTLYNKVHEIKEEIKRQKQIMKNLQKQID